MSPNAEIIPASYRNRLTRWLLALLSLVAFAWRLHGLSRQSLWRDEVDAIFFALRDLSATLSMFDSAGQNGALFFLALRPWLRFFGSSEFALRYPSVIFGVLAVPLLWQVGRRLMPQNNSPTAGRTRKDRQRSSSPWSRTLWQATVGNAALLAAVFLAINPYHFWYSQDGKMYSLVILLALLAAWFWLGGIAQGGWRPWLGFLITTSVAMYTHLLMILLIPLFFVWFLLAWPQSKHHRSGYLLTLAGLTLPYLPFVWWQWDLLAASDQLTAIEFTPLAGVVSSLLLYQSQSILPPGNPIWRVPLIASILSALFLGFQAISPSSSGILPHLSGKRRHLLIVSWLIVPVLSIYLLSLRQPVFVPRYIIWIAPAAVMLLALGAQLLRLYAGNLAKPLATLLVVYVIAYWGYLGYLEKTLDLKDDLRGGVQYIYQRRQADELLILQIPHLEYAYRYYSSERGPDPFAGSDERLGRWVEGLYTAGELDENQARQFVDEEMRQMTASAAAIWVLYADEETADPRYWMDEWLNQNLTLVDAADFHGTRVRYYHLE